MVRKVILESNWGADGLAVAAVALANPDEFKVLGATSVFGNTNQAQVLDNAGRILNFLGVPQIPYFPGAAIANDGREAAKDNAHGDNGMGGVILPPNPYPPQKIGAVDFILQTLDNEPAKSVTIFASGPQTNIANAIRTNRKVMEKVAEIVIMGGCTAPPIHPVTLPPRMGNVTIDAEFNFHQAPEDARYVMKSGLPITLLPMNCTHQLTLTPEREEILFNALGPDPAAAVAIITMMRAPMDLDRTKFGSFPIMHDFHTINSALHPELYTGRYGYVDVTAEGPAKGRTDFRPAQGGPVLVLEKVLKPDLAFSHYADALQACILRSDIRPDYSQIRLPQPK